MGKERNGQGGEMMTPLLRRRGNAEGMGWLFLDNRILITCEDQKQPPLSSSTPSPPSQEGSF